MDTDATRSWYRTSEPWDCPCEKCRRFVRLAETRLLPQEALDILDGLGLPPENATYVCCLDDEDLFQFDYRLAGTVLTDSDKPRSIHCEQEIYPYCAEGFPEPHFDLIFYLPLPKAE